MTSYMFFMAVSSPLVPPDTVPGTQGGFALPWFFFMGGESVSAEIPVVSLDSPGVTTVSWGFFSG